MITYTEILAALEVLAASEDPNAFRARRALTALSRPARGVGAAITRNDEAGLAYLADVNIKTARKASRCGLATVRGRPAERLAEAAALLGITLPTPLIAA
jgi:hypothetical protein